MARGLIWGSSMQRFGRHKSRDLNLEVIKGCNNMGVGCPQGDTMDNATKERTVDEPWRAPILREP